MMIKCRVKVGKMLKRQQPEQRAYNSKRPTEYWSDYLRWLLTNEQMCNSKTRSHGLLLHVVLYYFSSFIDSVSSTDLFLIVFTNSVVHNLTSHSRGVFRRFYGIGGCFENFKDRWNFKNILSEVKICKNIWHWRVIFFWTILHFSYLHGNFQR